MRSDGNAVGLATTAAMWITSAILGAACTATVLFALGTLVSRPLDGTEGLLLFDASRIREALPLYVDPLRGAWEYGAMPSRTWVLHTPLWAAVLSLVPAAIAAPTARALGTGMWLGLLAGTALTARADNRNVVWLGAALLAGAYPLTSFAAAGRHDAPALLLAGVALLRSMRRGSAGTLEGALFALAAFVKPNVLGAAAGVIACTLAAGGRRALEALAGAAGVTLACATTLQLVSGGAWIEHLVASAQATPMLRLWLDQMASRLPFFALPLATAFAVAWRARRTSAGRVGLWALAASTLWTIVSLAKIGSASNYWMEPCVTALAIAALVPLPSLHGATALAASLGALLQSAWVGVAGVRSSLEVLTDAPRRAAVLAAARTTCGAAAGDVVLADEPGLEVMLNGRAVQMPFAMTQGVRSGRYPEALWQADVAREPVRCLVMQSDLLERSMDRVDPASDLFGSGMRQTLRDRFTLVQASEGLWIYAAWREVTLRSPRRD